MTLSSQRTDGVDHLDKGSTDWGPTYIERYSVGPCSEILLFPSTLRSFW